VDRLLELVTAAVVFLTGVLAAYNMSVLINYLAVQKRLKPIPYRTGSPSRPDGHQTTQVLRNVNRIGIVLAGAGAKGAFQAGAMKAIYQYLADNQALSKVKVVASTSTGSWNALFWLSDLIMPEHGWSTASIHESWWRSMKARSLIAPIFYLPFFNRSLAS